MHIATLIPDRSANAEYRLFLPMQELERRGHRVMGYWIENLESTQELLTADVVYAWRIHSQSFLRLAAIVRNAGVGLVWDNDDDLTAIDVRGRANHKFFSGLNGQRLFARMTSAMRLAHVVTTPSHGLAKRYSAASGADVRVLENYLADTDTTRSRPKDRIVIGWVAHLEHQTDIERLRLRDTLQRLLDQHQQVEVVSIGCGLGLVGGRYRHHRRVPFPELASHTAAFDIGIAPIVDTAFNRGRSNVKVKEYAAVKVPWLASPIGPYERLGEAQGGRLVADDNWYDALEALVLDRRARKRLAKHAANWAETQTIERNVQMWECALTDAADASLRNPRTTG